MSIASAPSAKSHSFRVPLPGAVLGAGVVLSPSPRAVRKRSASARKENMAADFCCKSAAGLPLKLEMFDGFG